MLRLPAMMWEERSLAECLGYPNGPLEGVAAREALDIAGLPSLASDVFSTREWAAILSLGEQQRLAIARLLAQRSRRRRSC